MTLFLFSLLAVCALVLYALISGKNLKGMADNIPSGDVQPNIMNDAQHIEAAIQAGIVGDRLTVSAIESGTYNGPLPERRGDGGWLSMYDNLRILKIAGINYRKGIASYTGRVMSALVPEPDNEYDKDAIKVVAEDRHHLGYIPSGQTEMVRWMTAKEFPYRCTAFIDAVRGARIFLRAKQAQQPLDAIFLHIPDELHDL